MNKGKGMITAGLLMLTAALILLFYNAGMDYRVGRKTVTQLPVAAMEPVAAESAPQEQPVQTVPMEMPEVHIQGQSYIGTLEIPSLERKLGIISHWNEERLKIAPCRYTGSLYTDDLVIAGHNYHAHFGKIQQLQPGDMVFFTDTQGNKSAYTVVLQEILMPEDVEEMADGAWDLTLFTCTLGGKSRITVRCSYVEQDE